MLFRFPEALKVILLIALCGALGALARYWLSLAVYTLMGRDFPWGTSAVNILGCFLFGLVWVLSEERGLIPLQLRFILLVGFMGSFTTFSTYIFESNVLLEQAQWFKLGLNLLSQNILGLAALYLGFLAGRGW
ncbi:fluoride efflux transporter CrcB [Desulfonatronum parangueonense]